MLNNKSHYYSFCKGFTLLELLIAVSLSAVLMTVLVVGLNSITRDWEKSGNKLDEKIDESLLMLQLEKAVLGTFPYRYQESNLAKEQLFFIGSETELQWVSTVSPDHSSGLKLWALKIKEDGGFALDVIPVYPGNLKKQLEKYQQNPIDASSYLLNYKISLHFLSENKQKMKQWSQQWDAKEKEALPLGVRFVFKPNDDAAEEDSNNFEVFSFIRAGNSINRLSVFGGGTGNNGGKGLLR